jgi:hypothetical protein
MAMHGRVQHGSMDIQLVFLKEIFFAVAMVSAEYT